MFYRERYQKKQQGFIDTSQKIFDDIPAFDFRYPLKPSMVPAVRPSYSLVPAAPDLTINIFLFLIVNFNDYEEKEAVYIIISPLHGVNGGARYYDANIGRFISPDSHVDGKGLDTQGYNRYSYARNNPVVYSDPSGHDFWSWINGICASIQSAIDNNRVLAAIVGAVMMVTGAVLCAVGWAPLGTALLTGGYSVMSRAINGLGDLSASTSLTFDTPGVGNGNNDAKDKNNHNDSNNHNNNNDTSNTPPADTQNHGQTDDGLTLDQLADRAQKSNDAMNQIDKDVQDMENYLDDQNFLNTEIKLYNGKTYKMGSGQLGDTSASDCIGDVAGTLWAEGYHIPYMRDVSAFLNKGISEGWLTYADVNNLHPGNLEFMYYTEDGKRDWNHVLTIGDMQNGTQQVFSAYYTGGPASRKDTLNNWNSTMADQPYNGTFQYMQINWGILNQYYPKQ
jgi:RHS repeat-associated protein